MHQQNSHVDHIEVGQDVTEATGGTIGQRPHEVSGVVEVTGHAPEAGCHEFAAVNSSITGVVRALNVRGFISPDGAGTLSAAEQVLLMVRGAEDVVSDQTQDQDNQGV